MGDTLNQSMTTDFRSEIMNIKWTIKKFEALYNTAEAWKNEAFRSENFVVAETNFTIGTTVGVMSKFKISILKLRSGYSCLYLDFDASLSATKKVTLSVYGEIEKRNHKNEPLRINVHQPFTKHDSSVLLTELKSTERLQDEGYLFDDKMVLHLTFEVIGTTYFQSSDYPTVQGNNNSIQQANQNGLDFSGMLSTGEFSDVIVSVISVEPKVHIKAHKFMLAARSTVFAAMLNSNMKEARTGEIIITDLTPEAVKIMLQFMYIGNFGNDKSWIGVVTELMLAADKYDLKDLTKFLNEKIVLVCTCENAVMLMKMAKLYKLHEAQITIREFIRDNLDASLEFV